MIKYYVRTTGERTFSYDIDYIVLKDEEHNSCKHFVESLELISDCDSVLMEDDLILCRNFQEEVEQVISKYPNTIINFFESPSQFYTSHLSTLLSFNQCTYYPKSLTRRYS